MYSIYDYSLQPIQTYYIHLRHTDYVISYNNFENLYYFYKNTQKLDPAKYDEWKAALESSDNYNHFLPLDNFSTDYTSRTKMIIVIQSLCKIILLRTLTLTLFLS